MKISDEVFDARYRVALLRCYDRYVAMAPDYPFLKKFHDGVRYDIDNLPLLKLNRWLGWIQHELVDRGLTSQKAEQDWTRSLFRPLDFPEEET